MPGFEAHGGITFTGEHAVEILDADSYAKYWWIGFDCAHAGDTSPGMASFLSITRDGSYRDMVYVKAETERLAVQIAAEAGLWPRWKRLWRRIRKEVRRG